MTLHLELFYYCNNQGFLVRVLKIIFIIFMQYGREITHFYHRGCVTLCIFILGQCVAVTH